VVTGTKTTVGVGVGAVVGAGVGVGVAAAATTEIVPHTPPENCPTLLAVIVCCVFGAVDAGTVPTMLNVMGVPEAFVKPCPTMLPSIRTLICWPLVSPKPDTVNVPPGATVEGLGRPHDVTSAEADRVTPTIRRIDPRPTKMKRARFMPVPLPFPTTFPFPKGRLSMSLL